ncbi:MAG: hypothetical protein ACRCSW_15370 [Tabrizicola sp.]
MTSFRTARPAALVALFLSLSATAASALTAEEVWADWQRLAKNEGVDITAIARRDGDRLVLTNIAIPIGPANDVADIKIGRIELQDRPDGTVAVVLPPTFPVTIDLRDDSSPGPDLVRMAASAPDFAMTIAGIGDTAAFDIAATSFVLSVEEVAPVLGVDEKFDLNLAIADLALRSKMDGISETKTLSASLSLGTLHADLLFDFDTEDETGAMSVDLSSLAGSFDFAMPPSWEEVYGVARPEDENVLPQMLEALADGLLMKVDVSHGGLKTLVDMKGLDFQTRSDFSSASGHFRGGIDAAAMVYDLAMGKTSLTHDMTTAPDIGMPNVSMGIDELAYGLSAGIGDLVTPQELRFTARVIGLTIPPEFWALADPTGAVDLTPLSFGVEQTMRYALGPEMLDPEWRPEPDVFPPMDIIDYSMKDLMFAGFGMTLDGGGSLTFDEADLVTFEGVPAPEGELSFEATGVNAFVDRLAVAGLVPPDQLTGLRFGLMFIAKVGETPDSLVSKIEFREKSFYLNGQKIR